MRSFGRGVTYVVNGVKEGAAWGTKGWVRVRRDGPVQRKSMRYGVHSHFEVME